MDKVTLKAEKRNVFGRKVGRLRKLGVIPASVYGKKIESESIQINLADFEKAFKETGETGVLELRVNGSKKPVLIHHIQHDPITEGVLHIDFLQVNLKEKVSAEIPIDLIGESPVEKQGLGTVVKYMDEVEVEALPTDLPEKFEIDVGSLTEVDQAVYLKDLKYDKGKVEIKEDLEKIIIKVEAVKEEKEEAPAPEVAPEAGKEGEGEVKETKTPEEEKQDEKPS